MKSKMKMKKSFLGVCGLLALASCSNDEVMDVNHDGDEITFNVVTNAPSRADTVFCNAHPFQSFKVWARYDGKMYINGDFIKKNGTSWENTIGTRYWPTDENNENNNKSVTFFASHNGGTFKWPTDMTTSPTETFSVNDEVAKQKDFVYAVKTQGKSENKNVSLNFRHALSQIVFNAKNTNPHLYVEIYGVSVCNVKWKGTFTYPSIDTDHTGNLEDTDHNGSFTPSQTISYSDGSWGSWDVSVTGETNPYKQYDITFNGTAKKLRIPTDATDVTVSLTNNATGSEFNNNAMLLLPQPLNTDGTGTKKLDVHKTIEEQANEYNTYFRVKCKIYNVADPTAADLTTNVCLWGADDASGEEIVIPASLKWEQGKKYIYTFVFGNGNGGYNPDDMNPVLMPITFDVKIDDFFDGGNTDVNMETNPETPTTPAS